MRIDMSNDFDVVIIGSGLSGAMLAAILAKHGVDVVLIDSGTHPRFAVGESTIPHMSLLLSVLAERYGVPEIEHLAYPDRVAQSVCSTCGIKRAFGFAYHRPGKIYDPTEGVQFGTGSKDENHFFRQDIDAFLFHTALHYGAAARQNTVVTAVEIDEGGVTIRTADGQEIHARYVVDAAGHKSVLGRFFGLEETPTRFKHHSRSIFTHMIDVPPFDESGNPMTVSWHQSTLHHVFERGWFWVIPFNNRDGSTNPLISVGLTVDPRRYPKPSIAPDREFQQFLSLFPSVARQFADAKSVRPWVSTGRLQYSTTRCVGYRYCLMSHAAGFIDPLFSRGMINTVEVIYALLPPSCRLSEITTTVRSLLHQSNISSSGSSTTTIAW